MATIREELLAIAVRQGRVLAFGKYYTASDLPNDYDLMVAMLDQQVRQGIYNQGIPGNLPWPVKVQMTATDVTLTNPFPVSSSAGLFGEVLVFPAERETPLTLAIDVDGLGRPVIIEAFFLSTDVEIDVTLTAKRIFAQPPAEPGITVASKLLEGLAPNDSGQLITENINRVEVLISPASTPVIDLKLYVRIAEYTPLLSAANGGFQIGGGTLQCGHIAILSHGEGANATGEWQSVQLPNIPCLSAVIACPVAADLNTAFGPDGRDSANGRGFFYGDVTAQRWMLGEGQAEELKVSNLNQIYLRDQMTAWEDFNANDHALSYVVTAYWRVIR